MAKISIFKDQRNPFKPILGETKTWNISQSYFREIIIISGLMNLVRNCNALPNVLLFHKLKDLRETCHLVYPSATRMCSIKCKIRGSPTVIKVNYMSTVTTDSPTS